MQNQPPLLSKSRFMTGLQCHKALYLSCFERELADPIGPAQQAIFDTGTKIGEIARDICPGGTLIAEEYYEHPQSIKSTQKILYDISVPAIYEAGFLYDDIRIRADILVMVDGNSYDLIEVKSTTKTKEEHISDVAVQLYVLNGCGIAIRRACLGHLNNKYVYQGGKYDLDQLFQIDDITIEAKDKQPEVESQLRDMRAMLGQSNPPDVKVGRQCSNPYDCAFQGHCWANVPDHHVLQLPRVGKKVIAALEAAGIDDIHDIPIDFPGLNVTQQMVRDCVVNNRVQINPQISEELKQLDYPIHFLDFETFNPALPLYKGTSSYKIIPFQWSNHILDEKGNIEHDEYLHDGFDDPREEFARSLLRSLGHEGSIVVYSAFEASRIKELMQLLPHLSDELYELFDRIIDLLKLVRAYCYHPKFHGSFSIKSVLPALVPDLGYKDLEINDGGLASIAYAEIVSPDTKSARREHLRGCLLDYCERDTEAEVQLYKVLVNSLQG
jgi:predicted RecB family nuclease